MSRASHTAEMPTPEEIEEWFVMDKPLSSGADGDVIRYKDKRTPRRFIAVKMSLQKDPVSRRSQIISLRQEFNMFRKIQCNQEIVTCFGYNLKCESLLLEYCEFGDATAYRRMVKNQYGFMPEITVWKLFSDVAKGLHYLHNICPVRMIHGDLKPENILVCRPAKCKYNIPALPNFKIADFGRAVYYGPASPVVKFQGTYEYGPPFQERFMVKPPVDIYGLGAVIQRFALGILPIQSRPSFCKDYHARTGQYLVLKPADWNKNEWRAQIPVVYRPLNATADEQKSKYDWPTSDPPPKYSDDLNRWYTYCMQKTPFLRGTSSALAMGLGPIVEKLISASQSTEEAAKAGKSDSSQVPLPEGKQLKEEPTRQSKVAAAAKPEQKPADPAMAEEGSRQVLELHPPVKPGRPSRGPSREPLRRPIPRPPLPDKNLPLNNPFRNVVVVGAGGDTKRDNPDHRRANPPARPPRPEGADDLDLSQITFTPEVKHVVSPPGGPKVKKKPPERPPWS